MIKGSRPRPYPPTPQQFKIQPKGDKAHTRESNTDPQPLRSGSWYSFWSAFSVDAVVGTHKPEAKENPQTGYKPCDLQQVIHPRFQCGKEKNTRLTTSAASTTWGNVYETEHFLAKTTWSIAPVTRNAQSQQSTHNEQSNLPSQTKGKAFTCHLIIRAH